MCDLIREIRSKKYEGSPSSVAQFGFTDVVFAYDKGKKLFNEASFSISSNGLTLFKGDNGSGKTTVFKLLTGFVEPQSGSVGTCNGVIAFSSADGHDINPYARCDDFLSECLGNLSGEYLAHVLDSLSLAATARRRIMKLSSGQRQKLSLFRAFISSPNCMFLDEPLSHLDDAFQKIVIEQVDMLRSTMNILISEHTDKFDSNADNILNIKDGKITI